MPEVVEVAHMSTFILSFLYQHVHRTETVVQIISVVVLCLPKDKTSLKILVVLCLVN